MLQLVNLLKCTRLPYQVFPKISRVNFRLMSDKAKTPGGDGSCKKKEEVRKSDCKPKIEAKKDECKKAEPPVKQKDETVISGGAKCKPQEKEPCPPPPPKASKEPKKLSCEELILKREGMDKPKNGCPTLSKISGGGPRCPCTPCPLPEPSYKHSKMWAKISLMGVLPLVAILTILVFTSHKEEERPEFKHYPHMYSRTKPFYFGDHIRSRFHSSYWNALPPDGYEDEIDVEAVGKVPESDKEREARLKEFNDVNKEWKKMASKREAEAQKQAAAAEKEAKKQQAQAEKEEKKQQAEAEKERKRQEAEAAKEQKRLEAEEKKRAKEEAKKVDHSFFKTDETEN